MALKVTDILISAVYLQLNRMIRHDNVTTSYSCSESQKWDRPEMKEKPQFPLSLENHLSGPSQKNTVCGYTGKESGNWCRTAFGQKTKKKKSPVTKWLLHFAGLPLNGI